MSTDQKPQTMADAAEMLWVVLANVSGGDWTQQTPEWQEAAARWRDHYFAVVNVVRSADPGVAVAPPPLKIWQHLNGMENSATFEERRKHRLALERLLGQEDYPGSAAYDAALRAVSPPQEPTWGGQVAARRPGDPSAKFQGAVMASDPVLTRPQILAIVQQRAATAARDAQLGADFAEDAGIWRAIAQALQEDRPRKGCINCGEADDGGYETVEGRVSSFCSQCWEYLREEFQEVWARHGEDCPARTGGICNCGLPKRLAQLGSVPGLKPIIAGMKMREADLRDPETNGGIADDDAADMLRGFRMQLSRLAPGVAVAPTISALLSEDASDHEIAQAVRANPQRQVVAVAPPLASAASLGRCADDVIRLSPEDAAPTPPPADVVKQVLVAFEEWIDEHGKPECDACADRIDQALTALEAWATPDYFIVPSTR
jgi:hypothetical protein